jgi:hypothetical protein
LKSEYSPDPAGWSVLFDGHLILSGQTFDSMLRNVV